MTAAAPARSRYLEQVARIAPETLVDRETELAELAAFCTAPDTGGRYVWWQAEAWSGKSALMSWFVLHPPARVVIVSFFVTGRWAGQNGRAAFVDNMVEQLAAVLGQALPTFLTETNKETHLLGLLTDAAALCASRDERLVLLVDGVDEDRGVTTEADAHSILALLPSRPPHGTRVILSGRPHPPVPPDVPDDHPVREPGGRRPLAPSPAARLIRNEMERELKALLRGSAVEQDLLGLITAAGGGLTAPDLAELTGLPSWEVEDHLHTRSGRSFIRQASHFSPGKTPNSYLLGHEELAAMAREALGERRLNAYRDRIHAWAQRFSDKSWPMTTPEYFVRGYFALLADTNDVARMVRYATDPARQELMFTVSGGDAAALADLVMTLERCPADLTAMTRVAVHRDNLMDRNADVSSYLPMAWAALGRGPQALQLAMSIASPTRRLTSLLAVATSAALDDDRTKAAALAHAVALTRTLPTILLDEEHLRDVVEALLDAGDLDLAEQLVASSDHAPEAKEVVADALVVAGSLDRAERLVASMSKRVWRDRLAVVVAEALADAGEADRAEVLAGSIDDPEQRCEAWARLAASLATTRPDRAAAALTEADALAGESALEDVAGPLIRAHIAMDDLPRAEEVARNIEDVDARALALVTVLTFSNEPARTERLLTDLISLALSLPDGYTRGSLLDTLMWILASLDQLDRAAALMSELSGDERDAVINTWFSSLLAHGQIDRAVRALLAVAPARRTWSVVFDAARALVRAGEAEQAMALLDNCKGERREVSWSWSRLAGELHGAGEHELAETAFSRAEAVIAAENIHLYRSDMLAMIAITRASIGHSHIAVAVIDRAIADARSATGYTSDSRYRLELAKAAALAGDMELAQALSGGLDAKPRDAWRRFLAVELMNSGDTATDDRLTAPTRGGDAALASLAEQLAHAGMFDRAETTIAAISDDFDRSRAVVAMVAGLVDAGQFDRAESWLESVVAPPARCAVLSTMAHSLVRAGQADRAAAPLAEAARLARANVTSVRWRHEVVMTAAALAVAGQTDQAADLAANLPDAALSAQALATVGELTAAASVLDRALTRLDAVTDEDRLWMAANKVATALAAVADWTRAEDLGRAVRTDYDRYPVALPVVRKMVAAGEYERAEAYALSFSAPQTRSALLRPLTRCPNRDRAHRAIGLSLTLDRWHLTIEAAAVLEPRCVTAVLEELARLGRDTWLRQAITSAPPAP